MLAHELEQLRVDGRPDGVRVSVRRLDGSTCGAPSSVIDSTGTWMRRSSGLRMPASTMTHSRCGPTRKRATSSSGCCVAERPMRCTSRPACRSQPLEREREVDPRLLCATAWISSTITHCVPANSCRLRGEHQVERLGGGDEDVGRVAQHGAPLACGVSPVRKPPARLRPMPRSGTRRFFSTS